MSTLPATFDQSIINSLETLTEAISPSDGFMFLKLDQSGVWLFGKNNDEVEAGSEWAVNPLTAHSGFVSWGDKGGAVLGERMSPLTGPKTVRGDLPDTGFPWTEQLSIQLMCISGEDAGTAVIYKTNSTGGTKAINKLLREVLARSKAKNPAVYPVVELHLTKETTGHKTCYPILMQKDWVHAENFSALTQTGAEVEQLEEAPEPEPEPEVPVRRRRRRTAA